MHKQLELPFNDQSNDELMSSRENHITSSELMKMLKLSPSELLTISELIGFQMNPMNTNGLLFAEKDVWAFILMSGEYSTLCHLNLFANPVGGPYPEGWIVDGWLGERLTRLCELHNKGDKEGVSQVCREINSWKRGGGQS
jgi:hypothetical protein